MEKILKTDEDVIATVVLFWLKDVFLVAIDCLKTEKGYVEPTDAKEAVASYIETLEQTFSSFYNGKVRNFAELLTEYLQQCCKDCHAVSFGTRNGVDKKIREICEKVGLSNNAWPENMSIDVCWSVKEITFFHSINYEKGSCERIEKVA